MRKKYLVQIILVGVVAAIGLTGCHHGGPGSSSSASGSGSESGVPPLGSGDSTTVGSRPMNVTADNLAHGQFAPVLFEYDSARIRPSEDSKLQTVAAYVKANPGKLVIEGHCDERGTAEYNRALGERRALAARDALTKLGIDAGRISTVSYGSERPVDPGHDETAWSKNRRCEFVVVNQ